MLSAEDQLRRIEAQLLGTGGVPRDEDTIQIDSADLTGSLDIDLVYTSGHLLSVFVAIDVTYGYPLWTTYGFHLQDRNAQSVFRYDNAPHFPDMHTFPDHKHVGSGAVPREHHRPSLADVINEVCACVSERIC